MSSLTFKQRFRGFLPVVIDVETAGIDVNVNPLLQVAAIFLAFDGQNQLVIADHFNAHIEPYPGSTLDPEALKFLGMDDPFSPFRQAQDEKNALQELFTLIKQQVKQHQCTRAILVGHNAAFDHTFISAAAKRHQLKPHLHQFSTLDTVSLSAMVYGQTVLAKATKLAGIGWDNQQAHDALYDATKTAELFCHFINQQPFEYQTQESSI